jgi:hypothetical protein
MPFDPNTGAWVSGGDHPWNMPSTSAGDIIGGFNSYDVFQKNQEQARLHNLMGQLQLDRGQYEFGQEQDQNEKWDQFQHDVAMDPAMDESQLESKLIAASPEKGALAAITGANARRDTIKSNELRSDMKLHADAIKVGSESGEDAFQAMIAKHPDHPELANALRSFQTGTGIDARAAKAAADTRLAEDKSQLLEATMPQSIEGAKLRNDVLRAKSAILRAGKTSGTEGTKLKLSAMRLFLATAKSIRDEQYANQIMKSDSVTYQSASKEINDLMPVVEKMMNEIGTNQQPVPGKKGAAPVTGAPPAGAQILDLTQ